MEILNSLKNIFNKYQNLLSISATDSESQFIPLGIIGFIGFALYYVIWHNITPTAYESMPLRLFAMLLCLGLILKNYWPSQLRPFLPLYWYFTLWYIMPFFFTFMILKNNFSGVWIQNSMTSLFFLILLVDWFGLIVLLALGIFLGWLSYVLTTPSIYVPSGILGIIWAYIAVIGVGGLFIYNREQRQREKLQTMRSLGASIAHELRTPLRAIGSGMNSIKNCLPQFMETYQLAKDQKLAVPVIDSRLYKLLPTIFNNVESETQAAFTVIDMLLIKVNQLGAKTVQTELCSISHCVNEALRRYPFDAGEKELVTWQNEGDFIFRGAELLTIHIIFNLLKNALYYIKVAGKGEIKIWLEHGEKENLLHFKDTGQGVSDAILPNIFDRFFSQTQHGAGIGLAFCKAVMHSFDGDITCQSKEGEYTEFVLSFPNMPSLQAKMTAEL